MILRCGNIRGRLRPFTPIKQVISLPKRFDGVLRNSATAPCAYGKVVLVRLVAENRKLVFYVYGKHPDSEQWVDLPDHDHYI